MKQKLSLFATLFLLIFLAACGQQPTAVSPLPATTDNPITEISLPAATVTPAAAADPAPTVDAAAIADAVLAEVLARLDAAPTATPAAANTAVSLAADTLQDALIDVYAQANPAVVYVIVPPIGSGSGFVYSADGYIVTNNHVVTGGRSFEIVFAGGERLTAELVGTDVDSDLAVLKVDALPAGVTPLPLADFDSLRVGEFVVAIGNPFGEQGSMSLGIISALGRSLESQRDLGTGSSYSLPEVIQTDAPINPGNSGGPLLNLAGEVVGINSAIASDTGTNSGVGYAVPVAAIHQIVPSLIADGRYTYPYLGIGFDGEISLDEQVVYGLPQTQGAYVVSVTPGGPAADAGVRAASANTLRGGDLIVAIDDQPVNDFGDLNSYLVFHTTAGQTITLTILRAGDTITLPLTLGERP
ncbi:MAG: trypsin-like peptidase domain-containing protein [Anaerolineales bacterium]|nr:trypsin-like peptidase domain-containing protein [Anaerolineales bacterium]